MCENTVSEIDFQLWPELSSIPVSFEVKDVPRTNNNLKMIKHEKCSN